MAHLIEVCRLLVSAYVMYNLMIQSHILRITTDDRENLSAAQ